MGGGGIGREGGRGGRGGVQDRFCCHLQRDQGTTFSVAFFFFIYNRFIGQLTKASYLDAAHSAATKLVEDISAPIDTKTANALFDAYCRQNLLDNILRGGWPMLLGN